MIPANATVAAAETAKAHRTMRPEAAVVLVALVVADELNSLLHNTSATWLRAPAVEMLMAASARVRVAAYASPS